MQSFAKLISAIAIALVVVPSLLFLFDVVSPDVVKGSALVGTIVWFASTPLWMGRKLPLDAAEVEI